MNTVDVVFTVHSNYEQERLGVCLKLSFETNFLSEIELFFCKKNKFFKQSLTFKNVVL